MKICPRCQKTYSDDNLNFCLEDGSVLTHSAADPLPQTVLINEPRVTQQQQPAPSQPGSQPAWSNAPPQYSMQPAKKSSKTWIWVVGILGLVVLLCGGGLVAFFIWAASQADRAISNTTYDANRTTSPTPSGNKSTTSTSTTTSTRTDLTSVDLSMFVQKLSVYGTTEMTGSELVMGSLKKGFYYVLVAPEKYKTEEADTRVTVGNINSASSSLGYGLIFHSNPTPLQQDYAFLIDTKRKKYHVVHHEPQKETSVVSWTSSNAIKEGSEENVLEVRDLDDKIELYINGTMVTSIKNVYGYSGGVVGLYSGDGVKIAFKDLQIRK